MVQKSREPATYFSSCQSRIEGHVRGDFWPYTQPPGVCEQKKKKKSAATEGQKYKDTAGPYLFTLCHLCYQCSGGYTQHVDPAFINKTAKSGMMVTRAEDGEYG